MSVSKYEGYAVEKLKKIEIKKKRTGFDRHSRLEQFSEKTNRKEREGIYIYSIIEDGGGGGGGG